MQVEASRCQIAVDMLLFGPGHHGIATLGQACQFGGGTLLHFPTFTQHSEAEVDKVRRDMRHFLTRPLGMEAVLRVRTSKGINLDNFHGHFFVRAQVSVCLFGGRAGLSEPKRKQDSQREPIKFIVAFSYSFHISPTLILPSCPCFPPSPPPFFLVKPPTGSACAGQRVA